MYVLFVAQLVAACNDGAKQLERTEQLVAIHKQIDFGKLKVHIHMYTVHICNMPSLMYMSLLVPNQLALNNETHLVTCAVCLTCATWLVCAHNFFQSALNWDTSTHLRICWFICNVWCLSLQPMPIVSSSRYLVKRGRVTELKLQDRLFGRTSIMRRPIQLFSFSDFIIVGKKKKAYS